MKVGHSGIGWPRAKGKRKAQKAVIVTAKIKPSPILKSSRQSGQEDGDHARDCKAEGPDGQPEEDDRRQDEDRAPPGNVFQLRPRVVKLDRMISTDSNPRARQKRRGTVPAPKENPRIEPSFDIAT